jgi:hypothetical protein
VSNSGDTILTNVYVVSSQPNGTTPVLGPIELAPNEYKLFSGSYTVVANSDPTTDTVTAHGMNICLGVVTTASANCYGPVFTPVKITSVSIVNGIAKVTWSATPGVTYRLQCKPNPESAWADVPGDVKAGGNEAFKNESVGSNKQRFYRVMIVQ